MKIPHKILLFIYVLFIFKIVRSTNIEIVSYNQSNCNETVNPYNIIDRIIKKELSNDTLLLEIGFARNCCLDYFPNIKSESDTIDIYLNYNDSQSACFCSCCFTYNIKLKGISNSNITIKLDSKIIELSNEKYRTYPIEYKLVNGDTINLIDEYKNKVGIWTSIKCKTCFFRYLNNNIVSYGKFYRNGNIKYEYNYQLKNVRKFNIRGKLKK